MKYKIDIKKPLILEVSHGVREAISVREFGDKIRMATGLPAVCNICTVLMLLALV